MTIRSSLRIAAPPPIDATVPVAFRCIPISPSSGNGTAPQRRVTSHRKRLAGGGGGCGGGIAQPAPKGDRATRERRRSVRHGEGSEEEQQGSQEAQEGGQE